MTKKQVTLMSFFVALPAAALIVFYVYSSMFGNLFNAGGMILTLVLITGLLALATFLLPFFVMAWYPAEGFASLAPPPPPTQPAPGSSGGGSLDDDDEDGFDDEEGGFDDDDGFDDDGFGESYEDDGGEEMFDDGYDDEADFDDEEDLW